jgi:hypothetical protein
VELVSDASLAMNLLHHWHHAVVDMSAAGPVTGPSPGAASGQSALSIVVAVLSSVLGTAALIANGPIVRRFFSWWQQWTGQSLFVRHTLWLRVWVCAAAAALAVVPLVLIVSGQHF